MLLSEISLDFHFRSSIINKSLNSALKSFLVILNHSSRISYIFGNRSSPTSLFWGKNAYISEGWPKQTYRSGFVKNTSGKKIFSRFNKLPI